MATPNKPEDEDEVSPLLIQRYNQMFTNLTKGQIQRHTKESLDWFRLRLSKDLHVKANQIIKSTAYAKRTGHENKGLIGRMFLFDYSAQNPGDAELGIYDQYPLVFFFNSTKTKDGHTVLFGLNCHYLKPKERMLFFLQLLKLKNSAGYKPKKARLKLTWDAIKRVATHKYFERCVHAYRVDRIQSKLVEIKPFDWEQVIFLSLQHWVHIDPNKDKMTQSHYRKQIVKKSK